MKPQVLTEEEIKSAKQLYEEGATLEELGQRYDVHYGTVSRWIKEYGAKVNNKVLSPKEEKEVIKLFQEQYLSQTEIAKKFSICTKTVREILERHDIKKRALSESYRKYDLNQQVFEKITPESSYWIGFLLADGCVSKEEKGSDMISLRLCDKDKSHLKKFRNFLETEKPIYKETSRKHIENSFYISSQKIVDDLKRFGVIPRKSLIANPKGIDNRDFWRGVVDGDGCLYLSQKGFPSLILYGAEQVCKKFQDFVKNFCKTKASFHQKQNIYYFSISGSYARKTAKKLYENAEVYLDRKYEIAKQFFN